MKKTSRSTIVFTSLVGCLGFTSLLLMILAPAPLSPDSSSTLLASDRSSALDSIFDTRTPLRTGTWRFIYVHQSATATGNALTLAGSQGLRDHFIIGNGRGAGDGEIQVSQLWNHQQSALPPTGTTAIDPGAISIVLVGDFEHASPTALQMQRLNQLISTLQARFRISADSVTWLGPSAAPADVGRFFPADALRSQLLP